MELPNLAWCVMFCLFFALGFRAGYAARVYREHREKAKIKKPIDNG